MILPLLLCAATLGLVVWALAQPTRPRSRAHVIADPPPADSVRRSSARPWT